VVGQMAFSVSFIAKQSAVNDLLRKVYTSFIFFALAKLGGVGPAGPASMATPMLV